MSSEPPQHEEGLRRREIHEDYYADEELMLGAFSRYGKIG